MEQIEIQLDLFTEETPVSFINQRIRLLAAKVDNLRKGLFARFNELAKKYVELTMKCESMQLEISQLHAAVKRLQERSNEKIE